jgi:hypothetical protein
LLPGLLRSALSVKQVIAGIRSGHLTSPHFDSVDILNLMIAL